MAISPRSGCDRDIVDELEDLHCEASSTLRAAIVRQAQNEILRLRSELASMQIAMSRHADDCECGACWQAMEAGGGKG